MKPGRRPPRNESRHEGWTNDPTRRSRRAPSGGVQGEDAVRVHDDAIPARRAAWAHPTKSNGGEKLHRMRGKDR